MSYMVVETVDEDDKNCLAVPELWVKGNVLYYPLKTSDFLMKRKFYYPPEPDWAQQFCKILFKNINTLSEALIKEKDALILLLSNKEDVTREKNYLNEDFNNEMEYTIIHNANNEALEIFTISTNVEDRIKTENVNPTGNVDQQLQDNILLKLQKDIDELKTNVNSIKMMLESQLEPLQITANTLIKKCSPIVNEVNILESYQCSEINLPINTIEMFDKYENIMRSSPKIKNKLITLLSLCGGSDEKKTIRNIMRKLIKDEVLVLFSWTGTKSKKVFSSYHQTVSVISKAVQFQYPHFTDHNIASYLKDYIKQSTTRLNRTIKNV